MNSMPRPYPAPNPTSGEADAVPTTATEQPQSSHRVIDMEQQSARKADSPGELTLTQREFETFRVLIKRITGINLSESKRQMVERRLGGRLRALGLTDYAEYLQHLESGDAEEIEQFVNAVTTNLTSFFRENHHFEFLAKLLAERDSSPGAGERRLRIWSAGCSTGEEPYSIAATLHEGLRSIPAWDVRILATDLDSAVLQRAQAGVYSLNHLDRLPRPELRRWFLRGAGDHADSVRVKPALSGLISFRQLNLLEHWPMRGPFDVIFCRNVMIYFDKETQRRLVDRFADMLVDNGHLFIGHSESLFNVSDRFRLIGKTIYRKAR